VVNLTLWLIPNSVVAVVSDVCGRSLLRGYGEAWAAAGSGRYHWSSERLLEILPAMSDSLLTLIAVSDTDAEIKFVNRGGCDMLGLRVDERVEISPASDGAL